MVRLIMMVMVMVMVTLDSDDDSSSLLVYGSRSLAVSYFHLLAVVATSPIHSHFPIHVHIPIHI